MPPLLWMFVTLLLSLASCLVPRVEAWAISIVVTTQAAGAFGGEPFSTQPVVTVNNLRGELQTSFEGRVTVEIDASPGEKYVPVWKEGQAVPTAAAETFISESVVNGQAVFTGLGINTAGDGYRLKFVLYDEFDLVMGSVIGDDFTVVVGEMFQLGLVVQPEMAFGGSDFGSQPVLAVQDRGGNVVADVNEGMVRCLT